MARDFLSEVDFKSSVTLTSTDDGSAAAPELKLYRNSASPADADYIGQIKFQGENDNDQKVVYAKITGKIGDASDTSEDGIIEIAHQKAGSNNISARFTSDALKLINGTGLEIADGLLTLGSTAVTSTAAELNILDGVTSTTAELNILDGVTATTAELNIMDGVTSTTAELNILDGVTANSGGLNTLADITYGAVAANKAVTADANLDVASFRNVTLTGELDAATLDISGNADIDGTTNLDDVDIDGTVQIDGAVTVGVDDTGLDVKFFGATSGKYMLWDESADSLIVKDTVDAVNFKVNGGQGSDGQVLTSTGSGVAWEDTSGGASVTISDSAPGSPSAGNLWFESDTGKTFIYYGDGSSNQWVEVGGASATTGGSNTQVQYNSSGSLAGSANLTFDGTNLTVAGEIDAATLDISGNADIDGTTNLDAVDIDGAVQLDGTLTVGVDDTGYDVKLFGAAAGSHLLWDESENRLDIVRSSGSAYFRSLNGTATTYIGSDSSNTALFGTSSAHRVRFISDDTERMTILSDGKVGIGTSAPEQNLTVKAQNREISIGDSGLNNYPELRAHATGDKTSYAHMLYNAYSHTFHTSGTSKFYVSSGSNANFYGTAANQGMYIIFYDSESTQMSYVGSPNNDDLHLRGSASGGYLYMASGGTWKFYSTNSSTGGFFPYTDNTFDLGASTLRFDDVYATNGTIQTSDVNLKKDITDATLGLNFIKALRPVEYKWKDGSRKHHGFIAQEVKTVLDAQANSADHALWGLNTVKEGTKVIRPVTDENEMPQKTEVDNEARQSLRYTELIAPLVKAVQELTTRLEALESA